MPDASQAGAHISHTCNSATRSAAEQDKAQSDHDGVAQHRQSATFPTAMDAGGHPVAITCEPAGRPDGDNSQSSLAWLTPRAFIHSLLLTM